MKLIFIILIFISIFTSNGNKDKNSHLIYNFKNDSIDQTLKIIVLKNKIKFEYSIKNTKRNVSVNFKGVALEEGTFIGVDEKGNAQTIIEYSYKNIDDCFIYFSIEKKHFRNITIGVSPECKKIENNFTPLGTLGFLERIN